MKKELGFITTGVEGLDTICNGGIRQNTALLITGSPGSGKTIFAVQFLYEGARKGEKGLFITTEENTDSLISYAKALGIDISKYVQNGVIKIVEQKILGGKLLSMESSMKLILKDGIKRVVLDSLSLFEYIYDPNTGEYKRGLLQFLRDLKSCNITLLATSERVSDSLDRFEYKKEDTLFEGMIVLTKVRKGASYERCLHVAKLRGQAHSLDIFPFTIGEGGISVYPKELPFSLVDHD